VWALTAPQLLISVTGGAKRFDLKPRLANRFKRGLMKAATSTGNLCSYNLINNISAISWWSVLLVEETKVPGENHQPVASY
jgi:hypothetical protein